MTQHIETKKIVFRQKREKKPDICEKKKSLKPALHVHFTLNIDNKTTLKVL